MDVQKQLEYWREGSEDDFEAAVVLLDKGKLRQALFFAHLSLEKMLKAHVTRATRNVPPKTHNLPHLGRLSELPLSVERTNFLNRFDIYQMAGRYPAEFKVKLTREHASELLADVGEMLKWLTTQFSPQ